MKKNSVKSIILILLMGMSCFGQTNTNLGIISGKILDERSAPMPYANIMILDSNKVFLLGGISEENGEFKIAGLPLINLIVEISTFGYNTVSRNVFLNSDTTAYSFEILKLEPNLKLLDEIQVIGEKSTMVLKKDKKIFNVGKDILAQSSSALEVLENVPSVTVDVGGQISLRGNPNVTILIDGKRSGLTLNNALEQIPAVNIDRIEIITNPSSGYDAAGAGGILNIILKRNTDDGINGQITLRGGIPKDLRAIPSVNYKVRKLNLFATVGVYYTDYVGKYTSDQFFNRSGNELHLRSLENENRNDYGQLFYGGFDYYFNDKAYITAAYNLNRTKDTDKSTIDYDYTKEDVVDSVFKRIGSSVEKRSYNQIEFNYTRKYANPEQKFTIDCQYDFWNSNKDWKINTTEIAPNYINRGNLRTNNKNGNRDFVLKSDYITPLKEKSKMQFGVKAEHRKVYNNYLAESFVLDEWQIYRGLDNDLNYEETIGAMYAQYENEIGKFGYLIGLRNEYTVVEVKDINGTFRKSVAYNNLFPSLNLEYHIVKSAILQLNYSRRINRPSIWTLSPFQEIKDYTFQEIGNPYLNPSYTDAFEFSVNKSADKFSVNPSLYYHRTTDFFQDYIYRDTNSSFISKPINLELENKYGISISTNYSPTEKLKLYSDFNLYSFQQQGTYEKQDFNYSSVYWQLQFRAQVKLPKRINLQTFISYAGKNKNAQSLVKPIYYVNLSLNQTFFSKKLTIGINATNIFNSRVFRIVATNPDYVLNREASRNAQRFNISVMYRFTKKQFNERSVKESNRN